MTIEALEEILNAFKDIDEYFIACHNIFDRLSQVLHVHTPGNVGMNTPRGGHRFR